jgi:hypothetical protein
MSGIAFRRYRLSGRLGRLESKSFGSDFSAHRESCFHVYVQLDLDVPQEVLSTVKGEHLPRNF